MNSLPAPVIVTYNCTLTSSQTLKFAICPTRCSTVPPVWRPSVCLSIPLAYSPWLARGQHATRPAYISAHQYGGPTYLFIEDHTNAPEVRDGVRSLLHSARNNIVCFKLLLQHDRCVSCVTWWLTRSGAGVTATDNAADQTTGQYVVADVQGGQWWWPGWLQLTVDCSHWRWRTQNYRQQNWQVCPNAWFQVLHNVCNITSLTAHCKVLHWRTFLFFFNLEFLGQLFDRVDLIKPVSNVRPSVRTYVRTSVHPQKFIWFQWTLACRYRSTNDARWYGQGQGHELFKVGNLAVFKSYLLHHLPWELATDH